MLTSLNLAEGCEGTFTRPQIDTLWEVFRCQSGCDCELLYLIVRAQMLKVAMGYYRSQVDFMSRRSGSGSNTKNWARQDGWAASQGTQQSTRFADALSTMRYEDSAYGNAQSGSNSTSWSSSYDDSYSDYRDTGAGASAADSEGNRRGGAYTKQESNSDSTGKTDGAGERGGCTYSLRKHAAGKNNFIGILNTRTVNPSWSSRDAYSCNKAFSYQTDDRDGISERHVHGGSFSHSDSSRTSSSFFQAHVDQSATRAGASRGEGHSTAFRDSRAHSEGAGAGQGETLGQSQQSQQSTATGEDEGESHRQTDRSSFAVMDSVKAQQRFKHLLDMYDNAMALIDFKRRLFKARILSYIGQYLIERSDGVCAPARMMALEAACLTGNCATGGAAPRSSKSYGAYVIQRTDNCGK